MEHYDYSLVGYSQLELDLMYQEYLQDNNHKYKDIDTEEI